MSIFSGESIPEGTGRQEAQKRKKEEVPAQRMKKARITNPTQEGKKEKFNPMKYRLERATMRQKKQQEELAKKMANKEKMKKRQAGDFRPMWGPSSADDPNGNWDMASDSSMGSSIIAQRESEAGSLASSLHSASDLPPGFNYNIRYEAGETGLEDQPQLSSLAYKPPSSRPKRTTKNEKEEQEKKELDDFLSVTDDRQHGLQKFDDKVKGRCVKVRRSLSFKLTAHSLYHTFQATRQFKDGERVCEYVGDLITGEDAKIKEKEYDKNPEESGSYMYFFQNGGKHYW